MSGFEGLFSAVGSYFSGASSATLSEMALAAEATEGIAGATAGLTDASVAGHLAAQSVTGLTAGELALYGGTALNTAGQIVSTSAAADQAKEQARLGEEQAKIIETETEVERRAQRLQNRRILSRNRAVAGASGIDPFAGSPLEVELANAFQGAMNEQLIGYGGTLRANNARRGAAFSRGQIPGLVGGGLLKAGSSVLGDMYLANHPNARNYGTLTRGLRNA